MAITTSNGADSNFSLQQQHFLPFRSESELHCMMSFRVQLPCTHLFRMCLSPLILSAHLLSSPTLATPDFGRSEPDFDAC